MQDKKLFTTSARCAGVYLQHPAPVIMAAEMTLNLAFVPPVTLKQREDVSTLAAIQRHAAMVFVLFLICLVRDHWTGVVHT